jgi:hypothetical protein
VTVEGVVVQMARLESMAVMDKTVPVPILPPPRETHVVPPLVVLKTTPEFPATHASSGEIVLTLRRFVVTPEV